MSVVDDYLESTDSPQKEALQRVCQIIRETAPTAEEVITYGMPGFKYQKKYLVAFSGFKDHMSIFPGAEVVDVLKDKLDGYQLSKGTIQFTIEKPLSKEIIKELVQLRMAAIDKE
jgi:uncharacterized protein YdhG (YjbR/CyaY superfamily)